MSKLISVLEEYYEDIHFEEEINYYKKYSAYNIKNDKECILKIINKEELKLYNYDYFLEQIKREEEISNICNSEYIVSLYRKYETQNYIIFEYELLENDLLKYLCYNGELKYYINIFKKIVISIAKALIILHEKGIIHRNINPKNIFINNNDDNEDNVIIKLGYLDCSIYIKDNNSEPISNAYYAAPEIIKNLKYDEKCDLWSLGITLYELYFGHLPYNIGHDDNYYNSIFKMIYNGKNLTLLKTKIPSLDILFRRLLVINPKERMSYDEFFNYVFRKDFMEKDAIFVNSNLKYELIYNMILNEEDLDKNYNIDYNCCLGIEEPRKNFRKKVFNLVNEFKLPNIMSISNENNKEQNFNNIIYYDENIDYLDSIIKDSNYFEVNTHGTFILCTNLESLKLVKNEILRNIKKDKRIYFNFIVSGKIFEKLIDFLKKIVNLKNV